jgi:hypothetical protein
MTRSAEICAQKKNKSAWVNRQDDLELPAHVIPSEAKNLLLARPRKEQATPPSE